MARDSVSAGTIEEDSHVVIEKIIQCKGTVFVRVCER
jgi:hypothetical protein